MVHRAKTHKLREVYILSSSSVIVFLNRGKMENLINYINLYLEVDNYLRQLK